MHRAHMDVGRQAAPVLPDHGFGHELSILLGHEEHLAGGAAGIQALQAVVDAVIHQVLQALDVDLVIFGERGDNGHDSAEQFLHNDLSFVLFIRFAAFQRQKLSFSRRCSA